ncbi:MAG: FtsQ-type POTRA domain-containing protein, partial [Actinomycetota bacterium]|nr:FtsQ-type POTRA domain-containing protein [Actinomycetota bacterium]
MDSRIEQRRIEARRERAISRRRVAVCLASVLALFGVAAWLEQSPLLALSEVEVVGTRRLSPDEVREAAALGLGTSTLRLRLGHARERVEALPLVRSAAVRRADPLRVRITVVERRPILVLAAAGGEVLVDAEGIVVAPGGQAGLPVITTSAPEPLPPGASVSELPEAWNAFAVATSLPGPLRADVLRYEGRGRNDVVLVLGSGLRARFGRAEDVGEKSRALGALLSELEASAPGASVDVRVPSNP